MAKLPRTAILVHPGDGNGGVMGTAKPTVSVVLPAFNEDALIERTLHRVTDYLATLQARLDWEIIAVNDGSSDRTGAIMDAFAASDTRVRVLHHRVNTNLRAKRLAKRQEGRRLAVEASS